MDLCEFMLCGISSTEDTNSQRFTSNRHDSLKFEVDLLVSVYSVLLIRNSMNVGGDNDGGGEDVVSYR